MPGASCTSSESCQNRAFTQNTGVPGLHGAPVSQLGLNKGSGLNLVSTWSQQEKWSQLGLNLVSTRKVVSTLSQFGLNIGLNLVSTRERKNLRGLRRSESALNRQRFT